MCLGIGERVCVYVCVCCSLHPMCFLHVCVRLNERSV